MGTQTETYKSAEGQDSVAVAQGSWERLTDDEGLLGLGTMLIVPGRPAGGVYGPLGGAQERGLRLALAGGAFPRRQASAHRGEQPVQTGPFAATAAAMHKVRENR